MPGMLKELPFARTLLVAASCLAISSATAQQQQFQFQGSSSTTTERFDVEAPWILDWRVYSDFPQSLTVEIALLDARTGMHAGQVLQTKEMGNGVKLFNESGSYQLRIDSDLARWHVIVSELTEEEAERYTPMQRGGRLRNNPFRTRN